MQDMMIKLTKVRKTSAFQLFQSSPSPEPPSEEEEPLPSSRESSHNDLLESINDNDNTMMNSLISSSTTNNKNKEYYDESESDLMLRLSALSMEERDNGLHDLHGVADFLEKETPQMLKSNIVEMNTHLRNISKLGIEENPSAYYKALQLNSKYVEKMKIQCLRADLYHPRDAAIRLIRFFDHKYDLFVVNNNSNNDNSILVREITFNDLDEESADAVTNGFCQLLPQRDRSGRAIIMVYAKINLQYSLKAVLKALFYIHMIALQVDEAESVKNKGFILIFYGVGQPKVVPGRSKHVTKAKASRPCRYAAVHIWDSENQNVFKRLVFTTVSKVVESQSLVRLRFHSEAHVEVIYSLMTFGIPKEALPVSMDGVMDLTNHTQFLNVVKRREEKIRQIQKQQQQQRLELENQQQEQLKQQQQQQQQRQQTAAEITDVFSDAAICSSWQQQLQQQQQQQQQRQHNQQQNPHMASYFPLSPQSQPTTISSSTTSPTIIRSSGTNTNPAFINNNNNSMSSFSSNSDNIIGLQQTYIDETTIEQQQPQIVIPGPMDIIMGTRGRHPKTSPGNLRLHAILHEFRDAYDEAPKYEKVVIVEMVRKRACKSGCRFLKANDDGNTTYELGSSTDIREKISHAFRNLRRGTKTRPAKKASNNKLNTISSPKSNNNNSKKATAAKKKKSSKRSLEE